MFPNPVSRFLSKEDVRRLAQSYGVEATFSGNDRTMYFKGLRAQEVIDTIQQMDGTATPFKLAISEK